MAWFNCFVFSAIPSSKGSPSSYRLLTEGCERCLPPMVGFLFFRNIVLDIVATCLKRMQVIVPDVATTEFFESSEQTISVSNIIHLADLFVEHCDILPTLLLSCSDVDEENTVS